MAEIRKHNPDDGDGLGKLVRDALGERIRPVEPGSPPRAGGDRDIEDGDEGENPSASTLPSWPSEGQHFTF